VLADVRRETAGAQTMCAPVRKEGLHEDISGHQGTYERRYKQLYKWRVDVKPLLLILLVSTSLCFGVERFQLQSELRANFDENGATTQTLTGYTYDANGNRVQSRVWSGTDSTAAPMSFVKFTYDGSGVVTEALQLAGADTLTIVRYDYDGGKLIAVHTLTKSGALRFTDSLIYDSQGRNIEEQRISSAGVKTFYHHYILNAWGKKVADTLYELISSSYVATQAVLSTFNTDSTVSTETQWRLSGANWYCISTAFMSYAAGSLVSVATHERDGAGTGMTDSLAYAYDGSGNRTREEAFDGEKALVHRIVYTWHDSQTPIAQMRDDTRNDHRSMLRSMSGRLMIDLMPQEHGEIALYDLAGKRISRITIDHSGIVPLTGILGKGSYIAVFSTSGINKQVMNFTNYN
jgi:hypothetical protein